MAKKTVTCTVGSFPGGGRKPYTLDGDPTVKDMLKAAGIDGSGKDVRCGGIKVTDQDAKVAEGDQVWVFGNVRGN